MVIEIYHFNARISMNEWRNSQSCGDVNLEVEVRAQSRSAASRHQNEPAEVVQPLTRTPSLGRLISTTNWEEILDQTHDAHEWMELQSKSKTWKLDVHAE